MNGRRLVTRLSLWFGVLGGAIAWLLHLLLAYGIAEFGCVSGVGDTHFLGFSGVAVLELIVTCITLAVAISASLIAQRNLHRLVDHDLTTEQETHDPRALMARSGVLASRLFVFIIAVQSIPIFFYLRKC